MGSGSGYKKKRFQIHNTAATLVEDYSCLGSDEVKSLGLGPGQCEASPENRAQ
jgi:hypothetical protein